MSAVVSTVMSSTLGFQPSAGSSRPVTALGMVAVDPTTVTKKEYEDICGIHFTEDMLEKRLEATNFLYPKHVEVIDDIAPIAAKMVDDVVSLEVGGGFALHLKVLTVTFVILFLTISSLFVRPFLASRDW